METFEYNGVVYNVDCDDLNRHGGPWDRGCADSWYSRPLDPHYFVGDTYNSDRVESDQMTQQQIDEYYAGHDYNERFGGKKEY